MAAFDAIKEPVQSYVDIWYVRSTRIDDLFWQSLLNLKGYTPSHRKPSFQQGSIVHVRKRSRPSS